MKKHIRLGDFRYTQEMERNILQALHSGRISYGPMCGAFEKEFAALHQCKYGILSNSGTSSLQVALQALKELYGWKDGDEVIVPAMTFVATINIVYHCKMKPILVDVQESDYAIHPERIERMLTDRTRCIIPVHPFGQAADMPAIREIADQHNLRIIEDSCEAMFVGVRNRSVGAWGDVGCFSTYVAHLVVTGVGGICTTNNPAVALRIRSLVNHGIETASLPSADTYDPSHLARSFRFTSIGHSFRITEFEAAVGLPQLSTFAEMIQERRSSAAYLTSGFSHNFSEHLELPKVMPERTHSWMVYPLVLKHETKHDLMKHLRENGVECRDLLPLINQPCYKFLPMLYPVAQRLIDHGLYIPCHQFLAMDDLDYIIDVFGAYFDKKHPEMSSIKNDVNFYEQGELSDDRKGTSVPAQSHQAHSS